MDDQVGCLSILLQGHIHKRTQSALVHQLNLPCHGLFTVCDKLTEVKAVTLAHSMSPHCIVVNCLTAAALNRHAFMS